MKIYRMFLLHAQLAFEYKSVSVVYFLLGVINSLLYLLYWTATTKSGSATLLPVSVTEITSYYFLLIFIGSTCMSHAEEPVAHEDIKEGGLVRFLLRPFPYIGMRFLEELPWRLTQCVLSFTSIIVLTYLFHTNFPIHGIEPNGIVILLLPVLGYIISFFLSMIVGITAFWVVEYGGIQQVYMVIQLLLSGFVLPLHFLPAQVFTLFSYTPFPYTAYFPVRGLQGNLLGNELWTTIGIQCCWIGILFAVYIFLWHRGVREYTGIGQ